MEPLTQTNPQNNINFLRLFFASLVLVSHAPELTDGNRSRELLTSVFGTMSFGEVAVEGFFLLSGFLIVKSWESSPRLVYYFKKRVQRIYPGFVAAILLSVYGFAVFGVPDVRSYLAGINQWSVFLDALLLRMPTDVVGAYPGTPYAHVNGALWSISYEFKCYAVVALLGLLGPKRQPTIWATLLLLSIATALLFEHYKEIKVLHTTFSVNEGFEKFCFLFIFFSAGACFYLFRSHIRYRGRWALLAMLLATGLMFRFFLSRVGLATLGGYALFWLAFAQVPALARFKKSPDISYGIYLYGWPVQKLLSWYFPTVSPWGLLPFTFGLSCVAGYLSWKLVESPFLKKKRLAIAGVAS